MEKKKYEAGRVEISIEEYRDLLAWSGALTGALVEEKEYEAGRVEISTAQYRDIIADVVNARIAESKEKRQRVDLENEIGKTKHELELTRKKVCELENLVETLRGTAQACYTPNPALSTVKEDI